METKEATPQVTRTPWARPTDTQLAELKTTHGEVTLLEYDGHFIYVRNPKRNEFREWSSKMRGEPDLALETLVKRVVIVPPPADFDTYLNRFPALGVTFGERVLNLAGAGSASKSAA